MQVIVGFAVQPGLDDCDLGVGSDSRKRRDRLPQLATSLTTNDEFSPSQKERDQWV
jgi:hypothetical protein